MTDEMDAAIEGRLLALRQVLGMLAAGEDRAAILDRLEETGGDGQEDPGAVPAEGMALELALAEERRQIAREIRRRIGG